jgi:hypothetical protein
MGPALKMTWTEIPIGDMLSEVLGVIIIFEEGQHDCNNNRIGLESPVI